MRRFSGLDVRAEYPFAVTEELVGDGTRTLLVGISQDGGSLSTLAAMELAKKQGSIIATMCGRKDAVIDRLADHVLTVAVGPETAGAKTKGYYGTKLDLLLLARAFGLERGVLSTSDAEHLDAQLAVAISQFDRVADAAEAWVRDHADVFAGTQDLRFVGPSSLYGDTLEIALKALETLRVPVTGYEFNEFIHGIYNAINNGSTIVLLDDGSEPRVATMASVLKEWTPDVFVVGTSESADLNLGSIPHGPCATFLFPILGQMISALVPWQKGYDPSIPKDPTFHMRLGSKDRR